MKKATLVVTIVVLLTSGCAFQKTTSQDGITTWGKFVLYENTKAKQVSTGIGKTAEQIPTANQTFDHNRTTIESEKVQSDKSVVEQYLSRPTK
ncbi:MAG: hypothetical protein WC494_00850 [Candidatus Pacearchaeota archaeon]